MFAKITRQIEGFVVYLISGKRKDSEYTRDEKDNVIPLYGDLALNQKVEKYLLNNKNYKHNYLHITLSFSKEDMVQLYDLNNEERIAIIKDVTMAYIKHHTTGYNLKYEVVAYAEIHEPIIKEEKGKERLSHVHIQIMNYNLISDIQLRTPFAKTSYIDSTLETYVNRAYNFSNPMDYKVDKGDSASKMSLARKAMVEYAKEMHSIEAFEVWLNANNIKHRLISNDSNKYIKILNPNGQDINIRGEGFEHLSWSQNDGEMKKNQTKSVGELKNRLRQFYKNRIIYIESRRSKKSKEALKKIDKDEADQHTTQADSISPRTYQKPISYNFYDAMVRYKSMGYSVQKNKLDHVVFKNKEKDIKVEDKEDEVTANNSSHSDSLREKVQLMLEIAISRGWRLLQLDIQGCEAFKAEVIKQILLREEITQSLTNNDAEMLAKSIENRPGTVEEKLKLEYVDKKELERVTEDKDIKHMLRNLDPKLVLDYAVEKYKLNADSYEVSYMKKINNLTNEDAPKNVIDFLSTEVYISAKEATTIVSELFENQKNKKYINKNIEVRIKI